MLSCSVQVNLIFSYFLFRVFLYRGMPTNLFGIIFSLFEMLITTILNHCVEEIVLEIKIVITFSVFESYLFC